MRARLGAALLHWECQRRAACASAWHEVHCDCGAHATPRAKQELLEKCNPLGMFDSIATLAVASSMRELYRLVLVDTPLAPYFSESLSAGGACSYWFISVPSHMCSRALAKTLEYGCIWVSFKFVPVMQRRLRAVHRTCC